MRDSTDFEPWTKEKYRSSELVRLEGIEREDAVSDWKFFIRWVAAFGYEDASEGIAAMLGRNRKEKGDRE